MSRSANEFLENDSRIICRLCLANEENLINIFNPRGYHGNQLSEIIKELLCVEVSKEDGLPWTICKGCVCKVKDFKQFKMRCIQAKTTFLTMIASRGYVSSMAPWTPSWPPVGSTETIGMRQSSDTSQKDNNQVEIVEIVKEESPIISTYEYPTEVSLSQRKRDEVCGGIMNEKDVIASGVLSNAETDSEENIHRDDSLDVEVSNGMSSSDKTGDLNVVKGEVDTYEYEFSGVYTDAPLPDPLDMIDIEEGNEVKSLSREEINNHENNERENSLDIGVSDLMASSSKAGDTV